MQLSGDPATRVGASLAPSAESVASAGLILESARLSGERSLTNVVSRKKSQPQRPQFSPWTNSGVLGQYSRSERFRLRPNLAVVQSFGYSETSGLFLPPQGASQNPQKLSEQPPPRPEKSKPPPSTNSPEGGESLPLERPHHRQGHLKTRQSPKPSRK